MTTSAALANTATDLAAVVASQDGELHALRRELDETNRGVVALYAEVDAKFRTLYAQAPNGICLLDAEGRFVDANPALLRLMQRDLDGVVGKRFSDFVPPDWTGQVEHAPHSAWRAEFPLLDAAGERIYIEWSVSPLAEEGMSMAMATDVSERVSIERVRLELLEREQVARREAERLNLLKDDLIAVLSHELRTPLNAIMGWTHVLLRQGGTDDALRGLRAIERNGKAQARLISDILDVSSINLGKLQLSLESCDPAELVRSALEEMRGPAADRGVGLIVKVDSAFRPIPADPGRFQQIIWNLVSNAIKFCEPGGRIEVSLFEAEGGLRLSVLDDGHGIDAKFLPHLFDRFSQGDAASTRTRGGLGLGLSIVKHLVQLHGGTVVASSAGIGFGSRFEVHLPAMPDLDGAGSSNGLDTAQAEFVDDLPARLLAGVRILVVDDDKDALAILRIVLADRGADVETAHDVSEGLRCLSTFRPDVLVSDIGMPGKDGYDLLREVRRTEASGRHVPAVALTSFAREQDVSHALAAGFDAHCAKPLRPLDLIRLISDLARLRGQPSDAGTVGLR